MAQVLGHLGDPNGCPGLQFQRALALNDVDIAVILPFK